MGQQFLKIISKINIWEQNMAYKVPLNDLKSLRGTSGTHPSLLSKIWGPLVIWELRKLTPKFLTFKISRTVDSYKISFSLIKLVISKAFVSSDFAQKIFNFETPKT